MSSSTYQEILEFALRAEEDAAALYARYAGMARSAAAAQLLSDMSDMEKAHERGLRGLLEKHARAISQKQSVIADLRISDYLVEVPVSDDSAIEDVLIFAMKAEEKARQLYESLALRTTDPEARDLFEQLAGQEKRHKLELETEYDRGVLAWN